MKKSTFVTLAAVATLAAALSPAHAAQGNPFEATRLPAGYQVAQADKKQEASCGGKKQEASCGAGAAKKPAVMKDKKPEAGCGGKKPEAACGAKK